MEGFESVPNHPRRDGRLFVSKGEPVMAGGGKKRKREALKDLTPAELKELEEAEDLGDEPDDRDPSKADRDAALARTYAKPNVLESVAGVEARTNALSLELFGKPAFGGSGLTGEQEAQLRKAYGERYGDEEDEDLGSESDEDEEDYEGGASGPTARGEYVGPTEILVGKQKDKKGKKASRAKSYLKFLKQQGYVRDSKSPHLMRFFNAYHKATREKHGIPSDEDVTDYEYDSDAEEPLLQPRPPGAFRWNQLGIPRQPRRRRKTFRINKTEGFLSGLSGVPKEGSGPPGPPGEQLLGQALAKAIKNLENAHSHEQNALRNMQEANAALVELMNLPPAQAPANFAQVHQRLVEAKDRARREFEGAEQQSIQFEDQVNEARADLHDFRNRGR
jgi:hypothetical protein